MPDLEPGAGPTRRALRLLSLLQSRPTWSGPELAERLGVTTRSVRRDVERLRSMGYPVNAQQGTIGGYQLGAGRALPPLLLDDEEAVAVAVSLRLAAGGTVAGASEAALRALTKLDQVLPPRLRSEIAAILAATDMIDSPATEVDPDALLALAKCCRDRRRASFEYVAREGARTERRVEPVRLVATGRRWYLMAWDLEREDWRTFRLDRMTAVTESTWRFDFREHPDPVEYVGRSISSPYRFLARVHVRAPYDEVRARVLPAYGTVSPVDADRCLLEAGSGNLYALAFHLCWLGWDIDVLEPPELRTVLAELGDRMTRAGRSAQS
ncbi:helix-turn-helix transcriptional regulator [Nocardioides marmoriginsengisoli]|uniref:helix-turn-helix transcriptional regulator n=1 Tax=Nocardioides marmoriginsengisoli TaxID=661483 RepID=UPI001FEB5102|nr:YafY family protein [Nocardioides marmoriginsengisoli]